MAHSSIFSFRINPEVRHVEQLVSKSQAVGSYNVTIDVRHLPSGQYFYLIRANDVQDTGRFVWVK